MKNETGGSSVQIEVKIDSTCTEPKVIIQIDRMTEEIEAVLKRLTEASPGRPEHTF